VTLVSAGRDRDIRVWNIETGECTMTLPTPNGLGRGLQLSDDGRTLVAVGWWTLDVWDLPTQRRARSIPIPSGAFATWWSTDGKELITGHSAAGVRVWDLGPVEFATFAGHDTRCSSAISPDGSLVAVGDVTGEIVVRERATGSVLWRKRSHQARTHALHFSPDNRTLLSSGLDQRIRLWDARSGEMLREAAGSNAASIDSATFSADGSRIVAGWRGGLFKVLDSRDFKEIASFGGGKLESLAARFSPDGSLIATTSRETLVRLWTSSGEPVRVFPTTFTPWVSDFSPDGARLAVGTWAKTIELFDVNSGSLAATLGDHTGLVSGVRYGPKADGLIASAAADGTVRLWDADDPRNVLILDAFKNAEAITVGFSADGRWLTGAGSNGEVKVWDLHRFDAHIEGNREFQLRVAKEVTSPR
jgi:WD40 repeat protein